MKHTDDPIAREVARDLIATNDSDPAAVVNAFPVAEFETTTANAGHGERVTMRRVVLVGPWQVVPDAE